MQSRPAGCRSSNRGAYEAGRAVAVSIYIAQKGSALPFEVGQLLDDLEGIAQAFGLTEIGRTALNTARGAGESGTTTPLPNPKLYCDGWAEERHRPE
jgi:hypothetical protein